MAWFPDEYRERIEGKAVVTPLPTGRNVLIVSPLMVIEQTIGEAERFYSDRLQVHQVSAHDLQDWLAKGTGIGITNYEAIRPQLKRGRFAMRFGRQAAGGIWLGSSARCRRCGWSGPRIG